MYQPGGFYGLHSDSNRCEGSPEELHRRAVSVVVFLSGESAEPAGECHSGGALTLYGLMPEPAFAECGFEIAAEPGLLVAFRSNVLHEVKPVLAGERFTIVSWYWSAK
jgi:SM-20-related protein